MKLPAREPKATALAPKTGAEPARQRGAVARRVPVRLSKIGFFTAAQRGANEAVREWYTREIAAQLGVHPRNIHVHGNYLVSLTEDCTLPPSFDVDGRPIEWVDP